MTGLPLGDLSAMTGRQVPVLALFVPLALLVVLDGRRGVREACGVPKQGRRTEPPRSAHCFPGWGWRLSGPNSSMRKVTSGSPSSGRTSPSAIAKRCSTRAFLAA